MALISSCFSKLNPSSLNSSTPYFTMSFKRLVYHEIFGYRLVSRAKSSLISIVLFSLLLFFMFTYTMVSNVPLQSAAFTEKEDSDLMQTRKMNPGVLPISLTISTQRNMIVEVDSDDRFHGRIRRKLPESDIFRTDELTEKFHGRVLEFFNNKCELQFFMTWISTAESFGRREILAVDSVFKAHPNGCLMILSRTMDSPQGYTVLKPLIDLGFKVQAVTPDFQFLLENTPAETWFDNIRSGKKDPGVIPLAQNLSNLMRLAVLYKYGGIYLDTDFIVVNSFKGLKNTIGAQSVDSTTKNWTRLNNAVLVFDIEHPLLFKFIEEFALTFDGNKWGHNGPYMVSRVVHRVEGRPGYNFTILPPMAFYPVDWIKIVKLFKMPKNQAESKSDEAKLHQLNGKSYGVHLWNKQSSKLMVEEGSVMERIISEHCVLCEQVYDS
ncbi:hypothetical protein F3Y22_tig00117056pilonHSYRG01242 [Hibiscus syriacus]|uniref:Alpha 1,4-glycosyltransferase domain-containing protein n=1 Tax=Hibiscus syriacus TaxID=106335 RepID=A0A6A2X7B4_HIBSY|nr:lactosylceramide 4-alpha-galactosyltransferase-like [Hibiscus syriacus]KAE8654259.1 hypothetical protein F3Y22_tig00117056pilonHSYRG01242 [Hibiscus syriacus]